MEVPLQMALLTKKIKSFSQFLVSWALQGGIGVGDGGQALKYYTSIHPGKRICALIYNVFTQFGGH